MNIKMLKMALVGLVLSVSGLANAGLIFTTGNVVINAQNSATFDTLTSNGLSLNSYNEDGINVFVNDTTYQGFNAFNNSNTTAFHYGSGGNNQWVDISLTNGALIYAMDFLMGDGQGNSVTNIQWKTYSGLTLLDSGLELNVNKGTVGFTSTTGFTSIRLAAAISTTSPGFGNHQSIAIDDLNIGTTSVPEPSTLAIFALGVIGLASRRSKGVSKK